ncbi:uncharacterized protein LOC111388832 [Olea europaea var. sylvestris]|uniref:uncharacterized protein LOC111388832 n=1 Tax=Olea europaea var. sylvestris TaxID=158386 RepID=UPI000C1D5BA2|nr:uncharacterized protein LOC111388832 [Olea europaea var. sylvestris]
MAAPLIGALSLFHFQHPYFQVATCLLTHRSWCCAIDLTSPDNASSSVCQIAAAAAALSAKDPPKYLRRDDPKFEKWKQKEAEILKDIEPIIYLTKEILHSNSLEDVVRPF